MNINLHIERLVLDGISVEPHQRAELKAALELTLRNKFVENGFNVNVQKNNDVKLIRGGMIFIENSNHSPNLGQKIATAIYGGVRT
jgi:hypothetical protein